MTMTSRETRQRTMVQPRRRSMQASGMHRLCQHVLGLGKRRCTSWLLGGRGACLVASASSNATAGTGLCREDHPAALCAGDAAGASAHGSKQPQRRHTLNPGARLRNELGKRTSLGTSRWRAQRASLPWNASAAIALQSAHHLEYLHGCHCQMRLPTYVLCWPAACCAPWAAHALPCCAWCSSSGRPAGGGPRRAAQHAAA